MSVNKHSVAIVVWDDAHGSATKDVTEKELPHGPVTMTTMGWILREDDIGISIACERFGDEGVDYYRGHTFIPHGLIKSCTKFNLSASPRKPRHAKNPSAPPPAAESQPAS
jgi:hypothetical protein